MPEPNRLNRCPSEELLVAYLMGALNAVEGDQLDDHVDKCDACLDALLSARQRLSRNAEMAERLPDDLLRRMAAATPQRAAASAGDRAAPSRATWRVRRLPIPRSVRLLAPLALAAGALLVVGSSQSWWSRTPSQPQPLMRSVPVSPQLRVTAREALVRAQPQLHAAVIGTLNRGEVVSVGSEEREWYRVALPNGGQGWVEQGAFH
ncbi:MAG: SH3 domain-containing protein [Deltaproteobacteria bacterium]|nr:SH3 domain-containing protein [Deltaproteobacteria bacterium]